MINPWKVHRSRAVIKEIKGIVFTVQLPNGHRINGYDLPKKFKVGDEVNIQAQFYITSDCYLVKTVNSIRHKKGA